MSPPGSRDASRAAPAPRGAGWWRASLIALFLVAFAVRAATVSSIGHAPFARLLLGDGKAYDAWAQRIAGGDWLGTETFYQAPLYPYALGALYAAAGRDPMTVRWAQALLGSLAAVLLAIAGRNWFSPRAGLASGLLLALYPPAIYFDAIIQKSALDNLLMAALLALLGLVAASGRAPFLLLSGAVAGLLALTRENALVLLAIVALWLPFHLAGRPVRARAVALALFLAGAGLVLLPVGLRNRVVGGEFLVTTSQSGSNFYIGNHAGANGRYQPIRPGRETPEFERSDATEAAERALGRRLTPREVSSFWWGRALGWARANPGDWAALFGRKLLMTWNRAEIPDTESFEVYRETAPVLNILASILGFGVLLLLAAPGLALSWSASPRPVLLYLLLASFSVSVAVFYVFGRYRYPLVPILALFAGLSVIAGYDALRSARWRPAPAVAAAGAAGLALALVPPAVPAASSLRLGYVNLSVNFAEAHDLERAALYSRKAISVAPFLAGPHYDLGRTLAALGRAEEAETELAAAIRLDPLSADAHDELGALLMRKGEAAAADRHFREAYRIDPSRDTTLANLGASSLALGSPAEAAEWYRRAIVIAPDAAATRYSLSIALVRAGRSDEAIAELEAALRIDPRYAAAHDDLGVLLAARGDLAGAERHFQDAHRIDPGRASSLLNLGGAALAQSHAGEAADWFRKALAIEPDLVQARLGLMACLERLGRESEARAEAREVLARDPSNARARAALDRGR